MSQSNIELRSLLAQAEALPAETREGIVRFLELVMSLDGESWNQVPAREETERSEQDLQELRQIIERALQGGSAAQRVLFGDVFACVEKAYELGRHNAARLLLQTAIVFAAGEEEVASFLIQGATYAAALDLARAAVR